MPRKKYLVTLTPEEREQLAGLLSAGKRSALTLAGARILLKADQADGGPAWPDERIGEALDCGVRTVERVRQRFVEGFATHSPRMAIWRSWVATHVPQLTVFGEC